MRKTVKKRQITKHWKPSNLHLFIFSGAFLFTLLLTISQLQVPSHYRSSAQTPTITNCTVNATDEDIDLEEQRMLAAINDYRQNQGAAPLKLSKTLTRAATWLSVDMNTSKNMNHTDSTGRNFIVRIAQCGYDGNSDAENISNLGYADQVLAGWSASPVHNTNLLSTGYTVVGIARAGTYWTVDFGSNFGSGDSELTPNQGAPTSGPLPSTQPSTAIPNPGCLGSCQVSPAPSVAQPSIAITDIPEEPANPTITSAPSPSGTDIPQNPDGTPDQTDNGLIGLILNFLKKLLELLTSLLGA